MPPALSLVRQAGVSATEPILSMIAGRVPRSLCKELYELLVCMPHEVVLAEAHRRAADGWSELAPLFPVVKRLQSEAVPGVQGFLISLLGQPDVEVRTHALAVLSERSLEDADAGQALLTLLQDPNPGIVRQAIRKLKRVGADGIIPQLEVLVHGRSGCGKTPLDLRLLAIRALAQRGAQGWESLERCLSRLAWRIRRDDVQTAFAIATALERRGFGPGKIEALRRWRRSPARHLGLMLRRGRAASGA